MAKRVSARRRSPKGKTARKTAGKTGGLAAKRTASPSAKPGKKRVTTRAAKRTGAPRPRMTTTHLIEKALASFAHDVRTPLTGIVALGELLATSELGERERRWVAALKSAADHLVALTTLVVDAAKAELQGIVLRHERFDIRAFADSIADALVVRTAAKTLTGTVEIGDEVRGDVIGDPVRLRGALENLIDNAVKFTQSGAVGLKVRLARGRGRRLRIEFAVSDSGIGMSRAEIAKLFRPFAQASDDVSRTFGGAGLGLVLVKSLAQAMDGDLKVESKSGQGSTFLLSVVLAEGTGAGETRTDGTASAGAGLAKSVRILCAEDNPYGRVILSTILKELGHGVDFVGSGEAAVAAAARGGYDLVLMDVTLPSGNGIEATRRIRALAGEAARLPVIGISGLSSPEEEAAARAAGMNDYLAKPIGPARLARVIEKVLQNSSGR